MNLNPRLLYLLGPFVLAFGLTGCFDTLSSTTELIGPAQADTSVDISGLYYAKAGEVVDDSPLRIRRTEEGFELSVPNTSQDEWHSIRLFPLRQPQYYVLQYSINRADKKNSGVDLYLARLDNDGIHLAFFLPPRLSGEGCQKPRKSGLDSLAGFCDLIDRHGLLVTYDRPEYFIWDAASGQAIDIWRFKAFMEDLLDAADLTSEWRSFIRKR